MNLLRKIVKETILIPYRVAQGFGDAMDEVINPPPKKAVTEDE